MRPAKHLIAFLFTLLLCLTALGVSSAAVITVDPESKTAKSDVATLEAKAVRLVGEQVGFFVQSLTETPQKLVAKVGGLKDQDYDIYINQSFIGTKPGSELREGLTIEIPGTVGDPDCMRSLRALQPVVRPEYERMRESKVPEVMRVSFMFNQVVDFINSGIRNEKTYRSAAVILSPSGKVLQPMTFMTRHDAQTTAQAVVRACYYIQKARDRIYDVIKDPELRNSSLVTITPVVFAPVYSIRNGKPHVEAAVTNNCHVPIDGTISMALPKGWKSTAKSLAFSGLKSGSTHKLSFDLVPPTKDAQVPATVPMAATVKVFQDPFMAEVKFKKVAAN